MPIRTEPSHAAAHAIRRHWSRTLLLVISLWVLAALFPSGFPIAATAHAESSPPRLQTRRTPELRRVVHQKLNQVQRAVEANDFGTAIALLDQLRHEAEREKRLNSYEIANVFSFYGYIHNLQKRYSDAIKAYEMVLAQPNLPAAMQLSTRYSLGELYFTTGNFTRAAEMLEVWLRMSSNPASGSWLRLAQAQYEAKAYANALRNLETGMRKMRKDGQEPNEAWYVLQRALYYQKGDITRTGAILELLASQWPRKEYFLQLSGLYGEQGNKALQLGAMETVYLGGWMTSESELLNMAYLYLDAQLPYKAAQLLGQGLARRQIASTAANLELLGLSWRKAREPARALPELERAAALADDSEMWARLASIEFEEYAYAEAANAARQALEHGGGARPDNTRIVLGKALYNLGKTDEARAAFVEAGKDERATKTAREWLEFIDDEVARAARLRNGV